MTDDPRDKFATDIQYGRMTPVDAEAKLKKLGLPPLLPEPDPADFYAMHEVWWTLPMAIAWIAWRDHREVARATDAFRKQLFYWEEQKWRDGEGGPVYVGFFQRWSGPATFLYLLTREARYKAVGRLPAGAISIDGARALLWRALSKGVLEATGQSTEDHKLTPIPDYEWRNLEMIQERLGNVVRHRTGGGYDDVAFRSQSIMKLWPASQMDQRGLSLPETQSPHAPGYMPLYCAAQWIATRGGTLNFEPTYLPHWERAYSELLSRISSGDVKVTGLQSGVRQFIEGHLFASIKVHYPFTDAPVTLILSDDLYLSSYPYLDDEHWRGGFDDSLQDRRGTQSSQLMVPRADIARWWPFDDPTETHSGAPGRPSGMHLIEAEYAARELRDEANGTLRQIAAELAEWGRDVHPTLRMPTARTIENALRSKHRQRTK